MRASFRRLAGTALVAAAVITGGLAIPAAQGATPKQGHHVLLLSVDGLHDFDLNLWVAQHPGSNLAHLVHGGTTYSQASTSIPSDSFPGLLAMLTGGTPKSTGVFYDVSYDRSLYPPGSACQGPQGTPTVFDESIAKPDAAGNIPFWGSIDPSLLPLRKVDDRCDPVQPRDFLKVNTIFGVAHDAGLRTAWSDKHPAYQIVEGPGTATTVDDLFTPEINTTVTPANFPRPDLAITDWVPNTVFYDGIKVAAVKNEIDGRDSSGKTKVGVPAIFGMNFQAVSVGEKLVDPIKSCVRNTKGGCDPSYAGGGYTKTKTGALTFSPQMVTALSAVDRQVGRLVNLGPGAVLSGAPLAALFGHNERTPDIIVQPKPGTMFSTSVKKVAEHGGAAADDTHVALIVAGGGAGHATVSTPVQTRQIAPSILTFLGLDPGALQAVAQEGTTALPTR